MISAFFTTEFTTERLMQTGNKSAYAAHASGIGHLRQADDQVTQMNGIQYGEGWEILVDGATDIVATDRVVIGSEKYEVKGVRSDTLNAISIKRALMTKKKL